MKRMLGAVAVLTMSLGLAACGSDDAEDTGAVATEAAATEAPATEAAATEASATEAAATEAADTQPAATEASDTAAPDTAAGATEAGAGASAASGTQYVLTEWKLEGAASLPVGTAEITALNSGKFAHQFKIIKGTTYEEAPKNDLGTVQEAQLPSGSVLGVVEKIEPGATGTLSVELMPGNYLFVCNIEFGPNSHAGKGQVLNVTVA